MLNVDGRRVQHLMQHVMWLAMGVITVITASCRFDLPKMSGVDAPGGDGLPPQYSSCVGLTLTCGSSGIGSCCEPADTIEGGTFLRGYDAATDAHNDMNYPATVSTFVLDKYEVTVGRFRKFVEAGMGTQASPPAAGAGAHPRLTGSGWDSGWNTSLVANTTALTAAVKCNSMHQTWTDPPGINENKAMNCATWYDAMAFCIWDGGYLPTEAEWQYAASGGNEQRVYPWSNPASTLAIDCLYANYRPSAFCVDDPIGGVNRVGSVSPLGDGQWKHSDLAGNVWEWTLDSYVDPYPDPQTCNDCAKLATGTERVIRGGGFLGNASPLRAAFRFNNNHMTRHHEVGFRCARSAP